MKKIFLSILVLILTTSSCTTFIFSSQKVNDASATYYLPKKDLLLGFNVTYKTTQRIKIINTIKTTIRNFNDSIVESTNEYTEVGEEEYVPNSFSVSDIQLVENILPDYKQGYKINTNSFSKNSGKRQQQNIVFNQGTQTLASINGEAGTYTKEILQGIATGLQVIGKTVGAVFSAGTSLLNTEFKQFINVGKRNEPKLKPKIYTFSYDSICTITYKKGFKKGIHAEDEKSTFVFSETSPPQTLQLNALRLTNTPVFNNVSTNESLKLFYREPAIVSYQLENITQASPELLFSKIVSVPQLGVLKSIDTKVKGRNPHLAIDFDENGGLKKYEINTDRVPTDNTDMIQKIGDNTKDLIIDYRLQKIQNEFNYLELEKKIIELKKGVTN